MSEPAVDWLLKASGHDAHSGARPLRRTIQRHVEDAVSELLIALPRADRVRRSDRGRGRAEGPDPGPGTRRDGPVGALTPRHPSGGPAGNAARSIRALASAGLFGAALLAGADRVRAGPAPTPTPTPDARRRTRAFGGQAVLAPHGRDGRRPVRAARARSMRPQARRAPEARPDRRQGRQDHRTRDGRLLPRPEAGRPVRRRARQAELHEALGLGPLRGRHAREGRHARGRDPDGDGRRTAHGRGPRVPRQQEAHDVPAQGQAQGRQGRDPDRRPRLAARRREGEGRAPRRLQGGGIPLRRRSRRSSRPSRRPSAASSSTWTKATR